jgi:hypothetical protein
MLGLAIQLIGLNDTKVGAWCFFLCSKECHGANLGGKNGREKYFRTTPVFSNQDKKLNKIKGFHFENAVFGLQTVKLKRNIEPRT